MAECFLGGPDTLQQRMSMVASRRIGDPGEAASAIAWRTSDALCFDGRNLEVDGGMMQMFRGLLPRPGTLTSR